MPAFLAGLRYPFSRVLLPRTRLAYIHLRNLLTDAKRDRAARIAGYVVIWLPEELVTFYLSAGEVVNATIGTGRHSRAVPIASALEHVPTEPEFGEVCFHECDPEQLASMFVAQTATPEPWPDGVNVADPSKLFPYLLATTFDGVVEIVADDTINYLTFENGTVARAFLAATHHGTLVDRVAKLFAREGRVGPVQLRRWTGMPSLPCQAPPALLAAYNELAGGLVKSLVARGRESAPAIAEHARKNLLPEHPALEAFDLNGRTSCDLVADSVTVTRAVAAWLEEIVWTAVDLDSTMPETLLRELMWERRHLFQSAGLFEHIPWKVM
jgi:hypothetical protein